MISFLVIANYAGKILSRDRKLRLIKCSGKGDSISEHYNKSFLSS